MLNESNIGTIGYIKKNKLHTTILSLMFIGFWTLLMDGSFVSQSILTLFQALTLLLGVYYFTFTVVKKWNIEYKGIYLNRPITNTDTATLLCWLMFGLSVILSELIRGTSPHVGVMYFVYIPLVFFYIIPSAVDKPIRTTVKALMISGLIVILLSFLWEDPTLGTRFKGITNNPNSMGMVANQTVISSFSLFYIEFQKEKGNFKKEILYLFISAIAVYAMVLSGSRTSMLAVVAGLFIIFMHGLFTKKIKFRHVVSLTILFFLLYKIFLEEYFVTVVLQRVIEYANASNLTAGRTRIWGNVLQDTSLFGYGFEYFRDYLQIQAHNDIFQFIGMYGILTGSLLAIFLFLSILVSFQYALKNREKTFSVLPLTFIVAFIVLGIAETMIGFNAKTPTMIFYIFVGISLLDH